MEITLHTENHSYDGVQRLVYINNSPDTLSEVYYHLYYEAFRPGSMMDVRDRELPHGGRLKIDRLPPELQGAVQVQSLKQQGMALNWNVEETILRAPLKQPLLPGDSTVLEMTWKTQIPKVTRRGGWMSGEGVEYSMSQWYPKMAEYDASGWHADEYVGREFYGVFGTFDVTITLPAAYVVGATGTVTNPDEVGCGYQLGAVDTIIVSPASGTGTKTWRFHAENVHDFAWVADRDYVHEITHWNDVPIHLLYRRSATRLWTDAAVWTKAMIAYFSQRFGAYSWPQFTVAMAGDGGMEYPQLIMVTGYRASTSLLNVIAHEVGHQWFYGMIGNNETEEAWIDEGLTQYLTEEATRKLFGLGDNPYTGLDSLVYPWIESPWIDLHQYYQLAVTRYEEQLSIPHDWMREDQTSSLVYYKGMSVARMLEYMMGDSLFDAAMRGFVERWRYRHPSARDFEHAMEEASGLRLDWFFNQWISTTKLLDYAIDDLASERSGDGFATTVKLSNRNEAVMPLDIVLTYEDGSTAVATVPVEEWRKPGVEFHLPRWRWVEPEYTTTFTTPKRVVRAELDTSMLLADIDRTNNIARTGLAALFPPAHVAFYKRWDIRRPFDGRPLDKYSISLRPTLWYSQADGVQLGFRGDGGYAFDRYDAGAGIYYNIKSQRVDYDFSYSTPAGALGTLAELTATAQSTDGVRRWSAGVSKRFKPHYWDTPYTLTAGLSLNHEQLVGGNYPNPVAPWDSGTFNTVRLQGKISAFSYRLFGSVALALDASVASRQEFSQLTLQASGGTSFWGLNFSSDLFAGISAGEPPAQRLFNAAGATSAAMHTNKVQRLAMNIRPEFAARNHLVMPTEGFLLSLADNDSVRYGRHLANIRVMVGNLNPFYQIVRVPLLKEIDMSVYGAAGWIFNREVQWRDLEEINLEVGAVASINPLDILLPDVIVDALHSPAPVRLSFHVPFFASSALIRDDGLKYRFAIGVTM
jgi:hypothetical protein